MRRPALIAIVVTAVASTALAAATYATSAGTEESATVGICVKPNGQLRIAVPSTPCVTPEELQQWTVHGVAGVEAGAGLEATSLGGIASLRVDPALIEQANAGKIFAGFDDGPGLVNGLSRALALPPGSYAISAKLTVSTDLEVPWLPETKYSHKVTCKLSAGADFDRARTIVSGTRQEDETQAAGLSLLVVHRFDASGEAMISCDTSLAFPCAPLGCIDDFGAKYEDLKIVAIRAASLSNQFLG